MNDIILIGGAALLTIIIWYYVTKMGLPREDEVH